MRAFSREPKVARQNSVDLPVASSETNGGGGGSTPGRCHFRHYRRRGVISDVIGKASTVKGFASAREPFRIFHISLGRAKHGARYFLKRAIGDLSGRSLSPSRHGGRGHEKRNTILFRYYRRSHYPKRSQLHFHSFFFFFYFPQRNRAPPLRGRSLSARVPISWRI